MGTATFSHSVPEATVITTESCPPFRVTPSPGVKVTVRAAPKEAAKEETSVVSLITPSGIAGDQPPKVRPSFGVAVGNAARTFAQLVPSVTVISLALTLPPSPAVKVSVYDLGSRYCACRTVSSVMAVSPASAGFQILKILPEAVGIGFVTVENSVPLSTDTVTMPS